MMNWYRVDINPVPWAVGPLFTKRAKGKTFAAMGQNTELKHYQDAVKAALKDKIKIMEGPLRVRFLFWRQIDVYETYQARTARSHEADATNLQKALEDALHGIFYTNDKVNILIESRIMRQDPEAEGHIIIGIEEVALDEVFRDLYELVPDEILNPPVEVETLDERDKRWVNMDPEEDF